MLAYEAVVLIVGSIMGILTSYTDIKTGFIFDNHAFPLLGIIERIRGATEEGEEEELPLPQWVGKVIVPAAEIGILLYLYLGLSKGSILLALSGLIGLIVGFILGMVLYYAGAWASGDVVVLAAFSALLPLPLSYARVVAPYESTYPLYPLSILFNSILAVFPFLFFYALGVLLVRKETEELKAVFTEGLTLTLEVSLWIMAGIGLAIVLENRGIALNPVIKYLLTLAIIAVFGKYKKAGDAVGLAVLGYLIYAGGADVVYAYGKLFAVLYVFKVFFSVVKVLRKKALVEEVPVEELREWDILGETIYINGDDIVRDRRDFFEVLKEAVLSGNLKALSGTQRDVIASPSAEGLSGEQIEKLKEFVREGKLENRFLRKKSMPFAPSIFLGFLISALWGDIFWWLILKTAGL